MRISIRRSIISTTTLSGPYWPPERHYVEAGYRTIPFPFDELKLQPIVLETHWNLDQAMNYVGTWSAVQRYRDAQGSDPLPELRAELEPLWGRAGVRSGW